MLLVQMKNVLWVVSPSFQIRHSLNFSGRPPTRELGLSMSLTVQRLLSQSACILRKEQVSLYFLIKRGINYFFNILQSGTHNNRKLLQFLPTFTSLVKIMSTNSLYKMWKIAMIFNYSHRCTQQTIACKCEKKKKIEGRNECEILDWAASVNKTNSHSIFIMCKHERARS